MFLEDISVVNDHETYKNYEGLGYSIAYIVPVGELECFVKEVGDHGLEWANKVIFLVLGKSKNFGEE